MPDANASTPAPPTATAPAAPKMSLAELLEHFTLDASDESLSPAVRKFAARLCILTAHAELQERGLTEALRRTVQLREQVKGMNQKIEKAVEEIIEAVEETVKGALAQRPDGGAAPAHDAAPPAPPPDQAPVPPAPANGASTTNERAV